MASIFLYSCENDVTQQDKELTPLTEEQLDQNIREISMVLAKAVANNKELVTEIEKEISYRFDYDNDALIRTFLGRKIAGEKFEDILSKSSNGKYSSKDIEKMILESGYLQFTFPQNYKSLNYESVLPLAVPVYSYIEEEDTEYLESFDKDGNTVNLSAKEMPNVPVIVVGPSERVDEDGNMLVNERSVVLPKEMRTMHYTKAIEESRMRLKSATTENQHILKILSQEELDKFKVSQKSTDKKLVGEPNFKSATYPGMVLTGSTIKAKQMDLTWTPYISASTYSNRYVLKRDGVQLFNGNNLEFTDFVPQANMVYNYTLTYYHNDSLIGIANSLPLHSSHRRSGGKEYINRLYASHKMVVAVEGWWVSELEIKWDILIGNSDGTVKVGAESIKADINKAVGGKAWDTQKGDGSRFIYSNTEVDLFTWNRAELNDGLSYTIIFNEHDGGNEENVDAWVDVTALVLTTVSDAFGLEKVTEAIEKGKDTVKKIIKNLKKDDSMGTGIIVWWDLQANQVELHGNGFYVQISHRY